MFEEGQRESNQLLEHDDAADEGGPQGGAPCGGEAKEVGEFKDGGESGGIWAV